MIGRALPLLLTISACGTAGGAAVPDVLSERPERLSGAYEALSLRARTGPLAPSESAALARLEEAFGALESAAERWLRVAEQGPALRPWALSRLLGLVDRVPLTPAMLEGVRRVPALAELAEALAARLQDRAALDEARARLGTAFQWRRSRRLLRYPGTATSPAVTTLLEGPFESRAGFIASPEEGPGLYAFDLALPPGAHRVEVRSEHAVRAFVVGRLVHAHEALSELASERFAFEVELGQGEALQLHLVTRSAVARARVFVVPVEAPPETQDARGAALPLEALAGFERALAEGDIAAAYEHARAFPARSPLAGLLRARLALADPTRAPELARRAAKAELHEALRREPTLTEARALLVALHAEDQELDEAVAALDGMPALETAGLVLQSTDPIAARARVEATLTRLPRSCGARADWLDTAWERLHMRPAEVLATFDEPVAPLPGPCLDARLRAVTLLREAFQLEGAERVLAPLIGGPGGGLDPGPDLARAEDLAAELALARGDWSHAGEHARRSLALGGEDAFARELSQRAERLLGGPSTLPLPPATLGLPLAPSRALILAHLRRPRVAEPDAREILLDDRFVRVGADGSMRVRVHRIERVNDVAAVQAVGELPVPDDAELLVVRTWKHEHGTLVPLEPEDILEKSTISLPALSPGDFAEWAYFYPIAPDPHLAPGWRAPMQTFDADEGPVGIARFTLSLEPSAAAPTFVVDPRVPPPRTPDARTWVFEARDLARVYGEPLDPRPETARMTLIASSGLSHAALGDARAAELALATRPSPILGALYAEAVAGLPEGAGSDAILQALYDLVRRRIDEPPEASPFGAEASWVAERRRGSRALLLVALCREAGLACELVTARPLWEGPELAEPDPERLSYPLVRFVAPGRPARWLDPASRWMPLGLLPPALEGVFGVSLAPAGSSPVTLLETPLMPLSPGADPPVAADAAHWGERNIAMRVALDPGAKTFVATCEERLDGVFGASWRSALVGMSADARDKILGAIVLQSLPGATVESVQLEHLDDDQAPLSFRWRARGATSERAPAGPRSERIMSAALFPEALTQGTVLLPTRKTPLLVNRAARMRLALTLSAPEGWAFMTAPSDQAIDYDLGRLERTSRFEDEGRTVVIDKRFLLRPGVIEPSRYAAWADAAVAIDRADLVQLVVAATRPRTHESPP